MLTLPIKKKWWDMIASGEKPEEYRDITPYWAKRFQQAPRFLADGKQQFHAVLRAGYRKDSPRLAIRCWVDKGEGKPAWGAEKGKRYFRLHITWKEKSPAEAGRIHRGGDIRSGASAADAAHPGAPAKN